jgi:hypothetical protein
MRIPKWVGVLFFASLALNVGVLAGYAYQSFLWAQAHAHVRKYFQNWAPDAEKRFEELTGERIKARYELDSLRLDANKRIDELTYSENPDTMEVDRVLDDVARYEREFAAMTYRVGRQIHELQPPEIRRSNEKAFRTMMGLPVTDSTGPGPGDSLNRARRHPKPGKRG